MRPDQTVIMIAGTAPIMHWTMIPAVEMAMQTTAFFMDLLPCYGRYP